MSRLVGWIHAALLVKTAKVSFLRESVSAAMTAIFMMTVALMLM